MNRMDRKEFESIAPSLRESIVRMVGRLVPTGESSGLADDVAQDTLLRLWTRRDTIDSYRSIEALAMVMARNRTIDLLRREHTGKYVSLDESPYDSPDTAPDPHENLETDEAGTRLHSIIASLPSAQQALIRMRHVEEMEIDEIAAVTGSSPEAIRVMLSRARRHIKDLFLNNQEI